jgi:AAA+ superfamily predicted ATPase
MNAMPPAPLPESPRLPDRPVPPGGPELPPWYPPWARELAELYFSGTTCLFVLHGNVHDLVRCPDEAGDTYRSLPEFLATQLFGSWDVILHYDMARGLRPLAGADAKRLHGMVYYMASQGGEPAAWPRDPEKLLLALDQMIERSLLEEDSSRRKKVAILLDYAQYLVPAGDLGSLARGQGTNLVRLLNWAQNPYIKRFNIAFCLIADRLNEVNDRLVQSPHVATVEVPLPEQAERECFAGWVAGRAEEFARLTEFTPPQLSQVSNGLTLLNLQVLLAQGKRSGQRVDAGRFRQLKKAMIERQCRGLLEFVEPKHTLDLVVGQQAAKDRLSQDAGLLSKGSLDAAPMGYLLCGPVGTGKTFLAECYAGSVGVPCVTLRNFRSKYVGETEGNLEQVLTVLRSLGPVVVIIDEADAALGTREADGDAGTSSRVFSMIAAQMGDTRFRGRIVWMLLTSRPDLLPIDLKRQGRAEVHIPLFYPQDEAEVREMFRVMAKKNRVALPENVLPPIKAERHLSGSDIESIVIGARRRALAAGRSAVEKGDMEEAFGNFIPSAQGMEKEMQELAAVLECTELHFLPPDWRARVADGDGRTRLQERLAALRQLVRE